MKQLGVKLGTDQIEKWAKASAIQAIEELVWNAYDADASAVTITVELDSAGLGVSGLRIVDNGSGISFVQLDKTFEMIGDSVKRSIRKTPGGRIPRGRLGRGRFKAFTLSRCVRWVSRYATGGAVNEFTLFGDKSNPQPFQATEPQAAPAGAKTGVEVVIGPIDRAFPDLLDTPRMVTELSKRLALGLVQHAVDIRYDGQRVNPQEFIANRETITLKVDDGDGTTHDVSLTVIEWNGLTARSVYLCDVEGIAQHEWDKFEVPAARVFSFTAYAQSTFVDRLVSSGTVEADELSDAVRNLKSAVRKGLDGYFRTRAANRAGGLVQAWRDEGIYPYPTADASPVERVGREVFDVCAQAVYELLPGFQHGPKTNRKLLFRLLRQAIETDSGSLCEILEQVLNLTDEQQADLAGLLKATRLGAVISAAKTVVDRLRFLESTHHLFFGPNAADVNEPHQLQQILIQELWLFGDEFAFGRQEAYLRDALEVHALHAGRTFDPKTGTIRNINDSKKSRLDILLNSTYARTPPYDYEHLVIELKRSSVKLGAAEMTQIESYAQTVEDDPRFDKQKTKWTWLLIGVECDKFTDTRRVALDRPHGLIVNRAGMQVWVKTWAEVVSAAKRRYEFFLNQLETEFTSDDGLRYLQERYGKYLPPSLGNSPLPAGSGISGASSGQQKASTKPLKANKKPA